MTDIEDKEDFEELYGEWDPSLYDAAMINEGRFAALLGGPRYDDPYTIILTYDASNEQPWSRFDVRREIQSIQAIHPNNRAQLSGDPDYIALSISGDIYTIGGSGVDKKLRYLEHRPRVPMAK